MADGPLQPAVPRPLPAAQAPRESRHDVRGDSARPGRRAAPMSATTPTPTSTSALEFVNERVYASGVMMLNSGGVVSVTHQPLSDGGLGVRPTRTSPSSTGCRKSWRTALTTIAHRPAQPAHADGSGSANASEEADGLGSFALLLLDLDGFKAVNDTLGHATGDRGCSRRSRRRLEMTVGTRGLPARMGGDEFAVVMDVGATARDAQMLAVQLVETLADRRPFSIEGQPCEIAFSIGRRGRARRRAVPPNSCSRTPILALYRGQEGPARRLLLLRARDGQGDGRPAAARARPRGGARARRVRALLPADPQSKTPGHLPASRRCCAGIIRPKA